MSSGALIDSNLTELQLLSKGKVRDIYATSDPNSLLFVASDRISAYDVILRNVSSVAVMSPLSALYRADCLLLVFWVGWDFFFFLFLIVPLR